MKKILIKNFGIAVVVTLVVSIFLGTNLPYEEANLLGFFCGALIGVYTTIKTLDDISKMGMR